MKGFCKSSLTAAALIMLTVVAYIPAMRGGFVWDDDVLITDNPMIRASDGLRRFWFTTEAPDYYPLTSSLWWLEWRLWGDRATGFHITNVLLHIANFVLLWIILQQLNIPAAWLAAAIFAVHPVNAATVAWISEQKNTLSMLFYLLAVLFYLRFDDNGAARWYAISLVAFSLALLSKSAVLMLPLVLLACVWWRHGRISWKDFLRSVPFFVLSLTLGLVTVWFQHHRAFTMGGLSTKPGSLVSRAATAGCALWFYLYKVVLPRNLCAIYPNLHRDASSWTSYIPLMAILALLVVFFWRRKSWGKPLLFGLGYFVVILFPVLGFVRISFHEFSWVADPWQYQAMIGPIALIVAGGVAVYNRTGEWGRSILHLACVALFIILAAATWTRAGIYAKSGALWRDTVEKNPNVWVAHYNLGNAYLQAGRIEDAIEQYDQAVRIEPDHQEVQNNLAFALLQAGRVSDAIVHLEEVVRINPRSATGHYNLGNTYLRAGRGQDATGQYEQAVRLNPDYVPAHVNLGFALAQRGRFDEAMRHWETALRLDPGNKDAQRGIHFIHSHKLESAPQ